MFQTQVWIYLWSTPEVNSVFIYLLSTSISFPDLYTVKFYDDYVEDTARSQLELRSKVRKK